jgi:3-methyladenine DNA glycosylase/8-oxoguanine DNA glycosylase
VAEWIDEAELSRLEREHEDGLTSAEILTLLETHGIKFSEATLRKYVQLGLLPRSVRVGRKGKHQGSQGMYPAVIVRQILRIKEMLADDLTIEQIQKEFLFVRGDIEELERLLAKIFEAVGDVTREKKDAAGARLVTQELAGAKSLAKELVGKLESIEARLTARARLARRVAS